MKKTKEKQQKSAEEKEQKKKNKGYKALFTILGNYKKERVRLTIVTIFLVLSSLLSLLFPIIQERIYAYIYVGEYQKFVLFFVYYWLVELACAGLNSLRNVVSVSASNNIQYSMTMDTFRRFFPILSRKLDHENSGKFVNRITRDPSNLSGMYQYILTSISRIIRNLGAIVILFTYNWKISLYLVIAVSISYSIYNLENNVRKKHRKINYQIADGIIGISNEAIRGSKDIKVLDMQEQIVEKLGNQTQKFVDNNVKETRKSSLISFLGTAYELLMWTGFAFLALHELEFGFITVPAIIVTYQYSYSMQGIISSITSLVDYMNEKELISERVLELYDETIYPQEKFGSVHLDSVVGNMSIENVTFAYDEKDNIFENLNIQFETNKLTAIVGKSGEGKTSISNILFHLYDWTDGSVKLDGVDIRELDKDSLKDNISVIIQQPYIFNMTIKENLLLAKKDATDEELWNVLEKAQLKDYVESLEKKLDSVVGENGIQMSGGQKQRLSIARALLKNTKVIIFDEATSSLDNESQSKIQKVMEDLKGDHTLIVIAHRLSTIKDADKIVVLDNHQVSAEGTHEELMKVSNVYKGLYATEKAE